VRKANRRESAERTNRYERKEFGRSCHNLLWTARDRVIYSENYEIGVSRSKWIRHVSQHAINFACFPCDIHRVPLCSVLFLFRKNGIAERYSKFVANAKRKQCSRIHSQFQFHLYIVPKWYDGVALSTTLAANFGARPVSSREFTFI